MQFTRPLARKKNLLLCFDAFDTLYKPNLPVPAAYAFTAQRHGIECVTDATSSKPVEKWAKEDYEPVYKAFRQSYKLQTAENPNYGKATGLGAEKWWANVIRGTFQPFLKPQQEVPEALVSSLLQRYSSQEGYDLFPDAKNFFDILKRYRTQPPLSTPWKWEKTVVGVITNSDDRVPSILSSFGLEVGPRRVGTPIRQTSETTLVEDINFLVLSYDVGYEKPERQIFDAATEMLSGILESSSEPSGYIENYEKLYVGDSFEKDYLGAEKAGWHAVMIDRQSGKYEDSSEGTDTQRKAPLRSKSVALKNGQKKKVKVVSGLDELVNWNPKNRWSGDRPGRSSNTS